MRKTGRKYGFEREIRKLEHNVLLSKIIYLEKGKKKIIINKEEEC
jgi:hypothetical protein